MIYLDYNATTPVHPDVLEVMLPYFSHEYGNAASSHHPFGWKAAEAVDHARILIAKTLGSSAKEIIFNSGATEGINFLMQGLSSKPDAHILISPTEHSAVLDCADFLSSLGVQIEYLSVDKNGIIDLQKLQQQIRPNTQFVSIMLANNETGVIQPISEISDIVHQAGTLLLSDITQAIGKIPINLNSLGIDLAVCSAHKCYGPKGIGAVILPTHIQEEISPSIYGGGHEKGLRSGTLNIPGIVGFGEAVTLCQAQLEAQQSRISSYRNQIEESLLTIPNIIIHATAVDRIPNTISCSILDCDISLLLRIMKELAISTGSACHSNVITPSHVLTAMEIPESVALQAIRISIGFPTSQLEIERSIEILTSSIEKARNLTA